MLKDHVDVVYIAITEYWKSIIEMYFKPVNSSKYFNDCFEYIFHLSALIQELKQMGTHVTKNRDQ